MDKKKIGFVVQNFDLLISNWGLLVLMLLALFVVPVVAPSSQRIFDLSLSLVILVSMFATNASRKPIIVTQVVVALLAIWITKVVDLVVLNYFARLFLVLYFLSRVFMFINKVSQKGKVDTLVLIEAINGYLLMGIAFGGLIDFVGMTHVGAFSFSGDPVIASYFDPFYYAFVTMSTLGYGDLLPLSVAAKSISLFVVLCGQIYLVTIMAFLIGKLLAQK